MSKQFRSFISLICFVILVAGSVLIAVPRKANALNGYNAGFKTMEHPELLPFWLPDGTQVRQFISYDPSGGNSSNYFTNWRRYLDSNNETVIFDEYGPGCLYRQQMNIWHSSLSGSARIKYYFDDESTPRLNMTLNAFFGYNQVYTAPFNPPLTHFDDRPAYHKDSNFAICYYPFPFQKRLKITIDRTTDAGACWFQYTYLRYPTASEVQTWAGTGEDSAIVRNQWNNLGSDPKDPTGNVTVTNSYAINNGSSATVLDLSGRGSIASMKFTMNPWDNNTFTKTKLKIYWDNSGTPAVDMSLGSFLGGGGDTLGKTVYNMNFKNLFYGYNYSSKYFYCYWPMPYWSRARVVVENNSGENITSFNVDVKYKPSAAYNYPSGQAGYFHAKRTIESAPDDAYYSNAFEDFGRGKVIGLIMFSSGFNVDGDEFTYIDDTNTPSIHGDGTEDDHNQGWGGSNYQKPLWGGLINGYDGGYRTYYNEQYIYDRHIKITYEHSNLGSQTGQKTDFIIWYYKKDPGEGFSGNLKLTDQLNVGDTASETAHSYTINTQTQLVTTNSNYDGLEQNVMHLPCNDSGRYFKGFSQFVAAIDAGNNGVLLRRRLNRYNDNVQKADVYVDGARVTEGPWYFCDLNPTSNQAFADSNFAIPKSYTQGKSSITVRVQYLDAKDTTNGINEYYYWVYSYVPMVASTPTPVSTPAGTNLPLGATASASSIWDS